MDSKPFRLQETTIAEIHAAYSAGDLTCRRLVEMYLSRIEAYDGAGPDLNSIVTVNPGVIEEAEALDRSFGETGLFVGPLHGVPVLVKDQAETAGITTTFGSVAFLDHVPGEDATAVRKLKEAGAVILAKTLLPDFATSWFALSSAAGEAKNPYDLDRDPGGSSSGTGAAVAANLGAVGIGEDTGGSIRLPASFCNLVGVRVTTGLISRAGMSPLVAFQDTAGPMTRTVRDAALLLDALVGYDPSDPFTAAATVAAVPASYADNLSGDGLQGARIGVLREAFGPDDDPESREVNAVINAAIEDMRGAGATIVDPVAVTGLQQLIEDTALYLQRSKHDIDAFLRSRPGALSVDELYASKRFHPGLDLFEAISEEAPADPEDDPHYFKGLAAREVLQRTLLNVMASEGLDALLYPSVRILPPTREDLNAGKWTVLTFPTNTLIAPQADMPAISVPAGFTGGGLPVGVELLGKPHDETTLLNLAHAFEGATDHRKAPTSTPPLA